MVLIIGIGGAASSGGDSGQEPNSTKEETPDVPKENEEENTIELKFGEIYDIQTNAAGGDSITLRITSDNVSDEDLEKAIYVSAVEYIDKYLPEDQKQLAVIGERDDTTYMITFDENTVKSIRKISAEGDWGSEGVHAAFWFRDDLYEALKQDAPSTKL